MPKAKPSSIEEVHPVPKARNSLSNPPSPSKRNPKISKTPNAGSSSSQPIPRPRGRDSPSWAAAEQSFEEIVNGNLNNDDGMIEFSDDEEEQIVVVANAEDSKKKSTASKVMKKFVTGLVDIYTIIGKDPVVMGHSIFRRMMVTLHVTLTYGYYICLLPFKISERDGCYQYETLLPQQIITWIMQFICVCMLGKRAVVALTFVNIREHPNTLCYAMTCMLTFMLALAFVYTVSVRGRRFFKIFSSFNRRICTIDKKNQTYWKVGLVQFLPFLIYFVISNWKTWGIYFVDRQNPLNAIYLQGLKNLYFPNDSGDFYYYFVIFINITFSLYTDLWTYYVHAMLWAGACTVYVCEKLSRKVTLESEQRFALYEANVLLNNQRILMRKLNLSLGPIIVIFYIEIIPFLVFTICQMTLNTLYFPWDEVLLLPLKLGHIFIACEACSNADDLVYDILVKKVEAVPEEIEKIENEAARAYLLTKYGLMVDKFRDIVQRAICLRAMDYFAVNYGLVGGVTQWLITSALLIADWSRDSKECTVSLEQVLGKFCDKKNCKVSFIVTHDDKKIEKKKDN